MAKGTVNKVILVGRLGQDPDIRYSPNGVAVAKFSLATNDTVSAGEGKWEDRTEWHRIVTFAKTAEFCGNYLNKGRLVFLEGRIQTRQWDDAQGQKHYMTEIVAQNVQLLGSAPEGQQGQWRDQGGYQNQGQDQGHNQGYGRGQGQSQGYGQGQGQDQGYGQGQPQGQGQGQGQRSQGSAGRTAVEELPPHSGPPEDDIPF